MTGSILYCGDTDLTNAAAYLAGLMTAWGWEFDYLPSNVAMTPGMLNASRSLIILSDYPASQFNEACQQQALGLVQKGCGLLMIGGWESYHGFGGNWDGTALGNVLPVEISPMDDRVNFDQSAWLLPTGDHPITRGLPWRERPAAVGGMNRVQAKKDAAVLLNAHSFAVSAATDEKFEFEPREKFPAVVVGAYGSGRTASFLSDVAPHWVGGFVDWGLPRVNAEAKNSNAIEVGSHYATFWKQLLEWTGSMSECI